MIPYKVNPFGIQNNGYFEVCIKPGVLGASMRYDFDAYWNTGGYLHVVDWGDGYSQNTGNYVVNRYYHIYDTPGEYVIKLKGKDCYHVEFGAYHGQNFGDLVYDCNGNWSALGGAVTDITRLFYNDKNAKLLSLKSLPETAINATSAFRGAIIANPPLSRLPQRLTNGHQMFSQCHAAEFEFDALPAGLENGYGMFDQCNIAKLKFGHLPETLAGVCYFMFGGCYRAMLDITTLPDGITDGRYMFANCANSNIMPKNLPKSLANGSFMFNTIMSPLNISKLAENGPYELITNITSMFGGSYNVCGSRSEFLAACPNVTTTSNAFSSTNTTE